MLLEDVVSDLDDLCIEHGAFRYMHTKTVNDKRRLSIDPNIRLYGVPEKQVRSA